jgi:tRNA threonylcarbamoyl adenosine modification protein YjeE
MLAPVPDPVVFELPDEAATVALAGALAPLLEAGDSIALDGPLGAGKTTLVRALVAALGGAPDQVASPTYTLLHRYAARVPIVHIDAYRLAGPRDLSALGFDELADESIALVEWAERVREALPAPTRWTVALEHTGSGARRARVTPPAGKRLQGWPVTVKLG